MLDGDTIELDSLHFFSFWILRPRSLNGAAMKETFERTIISRMKKKRCEQIQIEWKSFIVFNEK